MRSKIMEKIWGWTGKAKPEKDARAAAINALLGLRCQLQREGHAIYSSGNAKEGRERFEEADRIGRQVAWLEQSGNARSAKKE